MTQPVYRLRSDQTGDDPELTGGTAGFTGALALYGGRAVYPGDEVLGSSYVEPGADQPVDPWTWRWWRMLPAAFRRMDREQGNRYVVPWHGWNQDPRWVLSQDRWTLTNASARNDPSRAVVRLSRTFWRVPGRQAHVQVWGTAGVYEVDVTARVVGHGHQVLAQHSMTMTGDVRQVLHLPFIPGGLSAVTVEVDVAMDVWSEQLLLEAVHVGNKAVELYDDLPGYADKKQHAPYPMLRFMDGPGRVVGTFSSIVDDLLDGVWTDPQTCPDPALQWLAMMMGVPARQRPADLALLREHLVHLDQWGHFPTGSAPHIAEVAARWLTGTRSVAVVPAQADGAFRTQWDQAVLDAAGKTGRVHAQATAPRPGVSYQWDGDPGASPSSMYTNGAWVSENAIPSPSHEYPVSTFSVARLDSVRDTTRAYVGTASRKLTTTDTNAYYVSRFVPARSSRWTLRLHVYTEQSGVQVYPYCFLYNAEGVVVDAPRGATVTLTPGVWTQLEHEVDASNVEQLRAALRFMGDAGQTVWADAWYMARTQHASPVYFDGDTPDSVAEDVWVQTGLGGSTPPSAVWDGIKWVVVTGNAELDMAAAALEDNLQDLTLEQANTLVLLVRPDEVPGSDLDAFAQFVTDQGVVPAGHVLVARNATTTWAAYEKAQGETWASRQAVITTWAQNDAAGLTL